MTTTVILMVLVGGLAVGAALLQQWALRTPPIHAVGEPPHQLDRVDFRAPDAPLLIAVFTSETCSSCAAVLNELSAHESATVAVENVEVSARADLHARYQIDSVPTAVIVDWAGAAQHAIVGPLGPDDRDQVAAIVAAHG